MGLENFWQPKTRPTYLPNRKTLIYPADYTTDACGQPQLRRIVGSVKQGDFSILNEPYQQQSQNSSLSPR